MHSYIIESLYCKGFYSKVNILFSIIAMALSHACLPFSLAHFISVTFNDRTSYQAFFLCDAENCRPSATA